MSLKLAVFDWNGTLFDDTHLVLDAVNVTTLPKFQLSSLTIEQYRGLYDMPIKKMYDSLGVDQGILDEHGKAASVYFHEYYDSFAEAVGERKGAQELLKTLASNGVCCIILSNHISSSIELHLKRLELDGYIESVLANEAPGRSHLVRKQERLEKYLATHNYEAGETVIVGDTPEETRIAKNLGLTSVAISGGSSSVERLVAVLPDHLVSSLQEVQKIMEELL